MRFRPSGTAGLMLELASLEEVQRLFALTSQHRPPGTLEIVPAARTITYVVDPAQLSVGQLRGHLEELDLHADSVLSDAEPELVEVPVVYDGVDLDEVSALMGCERAEVITHHTSALWSVAFCGFAPGFGYLVAEREDWQIPRRTNPRTAVPAGSVALAGEFSAVYPRESPGGWQLIGRTSMTMFDLDRDPPAVLTPGTRVRFVAVEQ